MFAVAMLLTAAVSYWLPGSANAAFATTYFVRTDGSNATCNGLTDASAASAPNCAFLTIQFAVNTAVSSDTINVAAGTYNESQVLIEKSVSVLGAGADTTIINGGNTPIADAGLVRINPPLIDTGDVTFSGFTVMNPGLTGGSRYHIFGKPNSPLSTVTISNNKFPGVNMSDYGLYADRPRGTVVFDHNELTNIGFNPILIEHPIGSTDVHHNTISGNAFTAYFNFTYSANDVTTLQRVADNMISGATASAISISSAFGGSTGKFTNVEITNNVITQLGGAANRTGISLLNGAGAGNGAAGAIENPIISGNRITGTDTATSNGIRIRGLVTNANIKSNDVRDVDRAVFGEVVADHFPTGTQAHYNNFVGNVSGFVWNVTAAVNAENNWWGCNFGPGTGGAGCIGTPNGVGGTGAVNVDADPWLTLTLTAAPTMVPAGGNSALTAKLTINSDGVDTAPSLCYVPDGTAVSFSATLGTVMPMNGTTTNGTASSTFTAGMLPGMGSASSTVDGQTVSQNLTILCSSITIAPASLPNAQVNTAYAQTLTASPTVGSDTFAVTSGLLPSGLTLNNDGSFSGAPIVDGVFNFRVTVTGVSGCTGFRDYTLLVVCQTITVNPASLPGGTVGTAYSQSVSATPAGTYNYTVSSGGLPPGLTLNASTGAITGTPTTGGSFIFVITAAAGGCTGTRTYTVTIDCPAISFTTASPLPAGQAGVAYSQALDVTPADSYTFSLVSGSLPAGLTLNPTTGSISGITTAIGSYSFTVKAQAANGCSATQGYTLAITCPTVVVAPAALPAGTSGTAYSQTISATPAGGNYTYAVTSGTLPTGLSLNTSTGLLSGTPTANGSFTFRITATGFGVCSGFRDYTVVIGGGGCPTITLPATLANGMKNTLYMQSAAASPGGYYTYAVTSGSLPPGVTLYANGLLFGYPTTNGSFSFTITATQGACSGSQAYTVVIGPIMMFSGAVVGDYDGDGRTDFVDWSEEEQDWMILESRDGRIRAAGWQAKYDSTDDVLVAGDYDGDGRYDLAIFRRSTGEWLIQRSSDGTMMVEHLNDGIPVPADYDGDGRTDIAVWQSSSGKWTIKRSSDGGEETALWGAGDGAYTGMPVAADYDGDGKADLAVYRASGNRWEIHQSSDGLIIDRQWGAKGDLPLAADYDGDGKTDIGVWRAAEGAWRVLSSRDGQERGYSMEVETRGEVPLVGDYDGDGKIDLAIRRGAGHGWRIRLTGEGDVKRVEPELEVGIPVRKPRR